MTYKLNLMPEELRKNREINKKALMIKVAIYSIVGLILLSEIVYASMLGTLKFKSSKLEAQINLIQPEVTHAQTLSKHNQELKTRIEAFERLSANSSWADLLESISSFMADNIWLTRMYIDDNNTLIIEGNADKLSTLGNFMAGLRSIQGFSTINLMSSTSSLNGISFTLSVGRGE